MPESDLHELPRVGAAEDAPEGDGTRRFKALWRTLGYDDRAGKSLLSQDERLTSRRSRTTTTIPPPLAALPVLTVGPSASDAELVLKTEIGDGGMGVIFAASQRSLGREVAVKRLVPEATGDAAVAALVQEARVTGSLDHPNVVPVHALGADAHGRPVMVMRRIHGTPWGALIRGKRGPSFTPHGDVVAAHIEVLLQVMNAVSFAHSRGVIHGDLKPDNVMLGAFGEVYVLDWGAALATRPNDPRGLPFAGDVRTVTGTPAYMAPEMVGMGSVISERTDVYLLGGILHEILTGAAPHAGATLFDVLKTAFVSRRHHYPKDVPRELGAICQRAMAADPAHRFADALEMRRALVLHLEHRTSVALAAEATARLDRLLALGVDDRPAARRLYTECRFGFEQALRAWEENAEAKAGLDRAGVAMVEVELASGDVQAALRHAAELTGPHPDLRARLDALSGRLAAEEAERARVEALGRDLDVAAHARPRRLFVAALATLAALMMFGAYAIDGAAATHAARMVYALALPLGWVVLAGAASWLGRRTVFPTRASRIIVGGVLAGGVAVLVNRVLTLLVRGGSLPDAIAGDLEILAAVAAMITLCADRRFGGPALVFLACAVLAIALPAHAVLLLALSLVAFGASSAIAALREDQGGGPLVQ